MTYNIPHICAHGGCMNMTYDKYCEEHKADAAPPKRSSKQYGYKWRKAREDFLRQNPFCAECLKNGTHTLASDVDHVVPHKGDMKLFWDRKNWQALCHECHSRKTAKENGGFGNRPR